eukprot:COSAG05_NODE_225_length_13597_cov_18.878723_10_plen_517_part_00
MTTSQEQRRSPQEITIRHKSRRATTAPQKKPKPGTPATQVSSQEALGKARYKGAGGQREARGQASLMCFGAIGGLLTSCLGACALRLGCAACGAVGGVVSTATRLSYALMLLFATLAALAMLADWVKGALLDGFHDTWLSVTGTNEYTQDDNGNWFTQMKNSAAHSAADAVYNRTAVGMEEKMKLERLVGSLAVYRIMMGVVIFHATMALALVGVRTSGDVRAGLQNSAWLLKLVAWLGLIVAMFVLSTEHIRSVAAVFLPGACLFLVMQVAMLVAGTYDIYDVLLGLAEAQTEANAPVAGWAGLILGITASFYVFSLTVFGATLSRHSNHPAGCSEGVTAVLLNMLLMLFTTALSISPRVREATNGPGESNGVFQSGMVAAYANWQVFSALLNHPEDRCHIMDLHGTGAQSKMVRMLLLLLPHMPARAVRRMGTDLLVVLCGLCATVAGGAAVHLHRGALVSGAQRLGCHRRQHRVQLGGGGRPEPRWLLRYRRRQRATQKLEERRRGARGEVLL